MTRDEAKSILIKIIEGYKSYYWYADSLKAEADEVLAFFHNLQPQPDSETGLMDCGCGGKAKYFYNDKWGGDTFLVGCSSCCIQTIWCTKKESREIWNRAVG